MRVLECPSDLSSQAAIYIYGMGRAGRALARFLWRRGIPVQGFVQTEASDGCEAIGLEEFLARGQPAPTMVLVATQAFNEVYAILRCRGVPEAAILNGFFLAQTEIAREDEEARLVERDRFWNNRYRNFREDFGYHHHRLTEQADCVLIGDSFAHGLDWPQIFGETGFCSRALPSASSDKLNDMLETCWDLQPRYIFVLSAFVDIYHFPHLGIDRILENYADSAREIVRRGIHPCFISTTPMISHQVERREHTPEFRRYFNIVVAAFNGAVAREAAGWGGSYLDVAAGMTVEGALKPDLVASDGIHLNRAGHRIIANAVLEFLQQK